MLWKGLSDKCFIFLICKWASTVVVLGSIGSLGTFVFDHTSSQKGLRVAIDSLFTVNATFTRKQVVSKRRLRSYISNPFFSLLVFLFFFFPSLFFFYQYLFAFRSYVFLMLIPLTILPASSVLNRYILWRITLSLNHLPLSPFSFFIYLRIP